MELYYIAKAIDRIYFGFFKKKSILISNVISIVLHLGLPKGWEKKNDKFGHIYYVDHNSKTTQWEDPTSGQSRDAKLMGYNKNSFIFHEIPDKTTKAYYKPRQDTSIPNGDVQYSGMVGSGDQKEQSYFSMHLVDSNQKNPFSFPPFENKFNPVCPYFHLEHTKYRNRGKNIHNCRLPRWHLGQWRRNRLGNLRFLIH